MEKIVVKVLLATCMLLMYFAGYAQTAANPNGVWTYSCPEAAYEYQSGKVEFKTQDGKLTMATVTNGKAGQAAEVTKKDKTYSCKVTIEGMSLTISFSGSTEAMSGYVNGEGWEIPISFKPEKK